MSHKDFGDWGEIIARDYIKGLGFKILEEKFRHQLGEIDLIAQDKETICFIEVKSRQSLAQGHPFEAITPSKIKKLSLMAVFYLKKQYQRTDLLSRFDVIAVIKSVDGAVKIEHIKNAFYIVY